MVGQACSTNLDLDSTNNLPLGKYIYISLYNQPSYGERMSYNEGLWLLLGIKLYKHDMGIQQNCTSYTIGFVPAGCFGSCPSIQIWGCLNIGSPILTTSSWSISLQTCGTLPPNADTTVSTPSSGSRTAIPRGTKLWVTWVTINFRLMHRMQSIVFALAPSLVTILQSLLWVRIHNNPRFETHDQACMYVYIHTSSSLASQFSFSRIPWIASLNSSTGPD